MVGVGQIVAPTRSGVRAFLLCTLLFALAWAAVGPHAQAAASWTVCADGETGCDFPDLATALTAVAPGDTLQLGPGIHTVNMALVVATDGISITGAQVGVDPRPLSPSLRWQENLAESKLVASGTCCAGQPMLSVDADQVRIDGVQLARPGGGGSLVATLPGTSSLELSNVWAHDHQRTAPFPALSLDGCTSCVIDHTFLDAASAALPAAHTGIELTSGSTNLIDTTFIEARAADARGVLIASEASPSVTNSFILGHDNIGAGAGIEVQGGTSDFGLTGSVISDFGQASVAALIGGSSTGNDVLSFNLGNNEFVNSPQALTVSTPHAGALLPANNVWWGDPSGPFHASANPGGQGGTVSDFVEFSNWKLAAMSSGPIRMADQAFNHVCQGIASSWHTIADAIACTSGGATFLLPPGTYNEPIVVNQIRHDLTFCQAEPFTAACTPTPQPNATIIAGTTGSSTSNVDASFSVGLTLRGLTLVSSSAAPAVDATDSQGLAVVDSWVSAGGSPRQYAIFGDDVLDIFIADTQFDGDFEYLASLNRVDGAQILRNTATGCRVCLDLREEAGAVENMHIVGNELPVTSVAGQPAEAGIRARGQDVLTRDNTISAAGGPGSTSIGIDIATGPRYFSDGDRIVGTTTGIRLALAPSGAAGPDAIIRNGSIQAGTGLEVLSNGLDIDARLTHWSTNSWRVAEQSVQTSGAGTNVDILPMRLANGAPEPPLPIINPLGGFASPTFCSNHRDLFWNDAANHCEALTISAALDVSVPGGNVGLLPSIDAADPAPRQAGFEINTNARPVIVGGPQVLQGLRLCGLDAVGVCASAPGGIREPLASTDQPVVTITANDARVSGLQITATRETVGATGVRVVGNGVVLQDLAISSTDRICTPTCVGMPVTGIDAVGDGLTVRAVSLTGPIVALDDDLPGSSVGLRSAGSQTTMDQSFVAGWGNAGLRIEGPASTVSDNTFSINGVGGSFCGGSGDHQVHGNDFSGHRTALAFCAGDDIGSQATYNDLATDNQATLAFTGDLGAPVGMDLSARTNHWGQYHVSTIPATFSGVAPDNTVDFACFLDSDGATPICPPAVDFFWRPQPEGSRHIRFEDTTTPGPGSVTSVTWDFGDGTSSSQTPIVAHSYPGQGTYTATLTYEDDRGYTASLARDVLVALPTPAFDIKQFGQAFQQVSPTQEPGYTVRVTNTGPSADFYKLSLVNHEDWGWTLTPASAFILNSGEFRDVTVTTTVPFGDRQSTPTLRVQSVATGQVQTASWDIQVPVLVDIVLTKPHFTEGENITGRATVRFLNPSVRLADAAVTITHGHQLVQGTLGSLGQEQQAAVTDAAGKAGFKFVPLESPTTAARGTHEIVVEGTYAGAVFRAVKEFAVTPVVSL